MELNLKLLLLGAAPPALAILAELFNPVRGNAAIAQTKEAIRALIPDRGQGGPAQEKEINLAGEIIARTADGAIEIAGIVPTWISVTAGVAGIASEVLPSMAAAILTAVIAAVLATMLPYLFARMDYYRLAEGMRCRLLLASSKRDCLSHAMIVANLLVILIAVGAAFFVQEAPRAVAPQTHIPSAAVP